MNPSEVLDKLKELGITITQRTLQRYEKSGLIPEPKRGRLGKGKGSFTNYGEETITQIVVARSLLDKDKWTIERIAEARAMFSKTPYKNKQDSFSFLDGIKWGVSNILVKKGYSLINNDFVFNDVLEYDKKELRNINLDFVECGDLKNQICPDGFDLDIYLRDKYSLDEHEDYPDDLDTTCPHEAQCIESGRQFKDINAIIFKDRQIIFKMYQRPVGTDDWQLAFEEVLAEGTFAINIIARWNNY